MRRHAYTPEQSAWLRMWYPVTTNRELADAFAAEFGEQVTPSMMNAWGNNHHVHKVDGVKEMANRKYTDEQLDFLREVIPGRPLSKVGELYEERYGVRLTHGALANLRTKLGVLCGVNAGRFRKGQEPPNKGRTWDEMGISEESQERMRATTFRKGNVSGAAAARLRPLLDVRTDPDGYRFIKVDPRGQRHSMQRWIPLGAFEWMKANGRDWPEGCRCVHADGDRQNDAAENIVPVPAELWPLVNHANPSALPWYDRETLEVAIVSARVTLRRSELERERRRIDGRSWAQDRKGRNSPARVDVD